MNNFTKKDLESISYGLECCGLANSPLRLKVLSMIDNYCEHEWHFYISPHGNAVRCNECNKGLQNDN